MEFEAALAQEALGVFGRTGLTPSQLADGLTECQIEIAELKECLILAVKDLEIVETSRYSRGICERARKALGLSK